MVFIKYRCFRSQLTLGFFKFLFDFNFNFSIQFLCDNYVIITLKTIDLNADILKDALIEKFPYLKLEE